MSQATARAPRTRRANDMWRVTIEPPESPAPFVAIRAEPTAMAALGAAEHEYSLRTNGNLNAIARIVIERVAP